LKQKKKTIYYFGDSDHEDWLREFASLEKDKALKGVTPFGITDSQKMVNLADFNLEERMCAITQLDATMCNPQNEMFKISLCLHV
jgi:hypothetical protein